MRTAISWLCTTRVAVLAVIFLFCCSDPSEEDVTPPENKPGEDEEVLPGDADALLNAFSFKSATSVTGSVPTVLNSSLLKTDSRDTIYTMPGVPNILRISHPQERVIKGIFIAVQGSAFYYDVPIYEEEETDTVSVIIYEIDASELEVPNDIPVEIIAYDDNGQPIDIVERIISVEDPAAGTCNILQDGDTATVNWLHGWQWRWTVLLDHSDQPLLIHSAGKSYLSTQEHSGCCKNSVCPTYLVDPNTKVGEWVYDSKFTVTTSYSIIHEMFQFFKDGTFSRLTLERQTALDTGQTDYCNGIPSIRDYVDQVVYYGPHDYVPGDNQISYHTTKSICDDPLGLCGYGSRGGQVTASCHAMIISAGVEGQKEMRMYTRTYGSAATIEEGGITRTIWED